MASILLVSNMASMCSSVVVSIKGGGNRVISLCAGLVD